MSNPDRNLSSDETKSPALGKVKVIIGLLMFLIAGGLWVWHTLLMVFNDTYARDYSYMAKHVFDHWQTAVPAVILALLLVGGVRLGFLLMTGRWHL